jgi:hypothetical protein
MGIEMLYKFIQSSNIFQNKLPSGKFGGTAMDISLSDLMFY